jgi:hypothetical protein
MLLACMDASSCGGQDGDSRKLEPAMNAAAAIKITQSGVLRSLKTKAIRMMSWIQQATTSPKVLKP